MKHFHDFYVIGIILLCLVYQIEVAPTAQEDENHAASGLLINQFFSDKK